METIDKIKGSLINGIYTKFYYVGQTLCYQIVVNYDKGQILYKDFKDYDEYQSYHKKLIEALNNKGDVTADFTRLDSTKKRAVANQ